MIASEPAALAERMAASAPLWLFLDYDGTLAEFAPTPDDVIPNPEVIDLLERMTSLETVRVAIISGRRLSHIRVLVPSQRVILAGTYGIELQLLSEDSVFQLNPDDIRPLLDDLKPKWQALLSGRKGFYLEDKGWSLAIHARDADETEAQHVIELAKRTASQTSNSGAFRILDGHKFIEISPLQASKGLSLAYLLDHDPWPEATPVFIGDDDKDEDAFAVVRERGGIAVVVATGPRPTQAQYRLESPWAVLACLSALFIRLKN